MKIDYNATVKPIVSILRKRSPNFNELATKYLGSESVKYYSEGWEENGLHIFDTLLSEIDHVIDVLGMTGTREHLTLASGTGTCRYSGTWVHAWPLRGTAVPTNRYLANFAA